MPRKTKEIEIFEENPQVKIIKKRASKVPETSLINVSIECMVTDQLKVSISSTVIPNGNQTKDVVMMAYNDLLKGVVEIIKANENKS